MTTYVLTLSLCLQVAAAVLALRLIRVTGRRAAWVLLAFAISLMVVRRSIVLVRIISADTRHTPDLVMEVVALAISVLMLMGIAWIRPLILSIRRAEEEVRQLIESAPDAMVVANDEDRIVLANAQAVRLFGYRRNEMVGMDVSALVPERFRDRHREGRARYHEHPRPRLLGSDTEVSGLRKDGTEFPLEVSVTPLDTASGEVAVSAIRDISERRGAEAALKESEGRYRSLLDDVLDSSSGAVGILDAEKNVVWVNRAYESFFEVRRNDVVGAGARDLVSERIAPLFEDSEGFRNRVLATYDDNSFVEQFECHMPGRNGIGERWLEHWSRPIESGLYAGGRIEQYSDVTERRLAEERIRLFAHIVRNMQVGLFVYRLDDPEDDRSLRLISINPEGEKLIAIPKDAALGQRIDDLFPLLREQGTPALFADVQRTGVSRAVGEFAYGDERVPESYWSYKAFALPDQCVGVVFELIRSAKSEPE
jgi:PAS domain S-box-containing protein